MQKNQLRTNKLGRTGLEVTRLGLGCFQFTHEFNVSHADAAAVLDEAFAGGIKFFDTAPAYGTGESELILAQAYARHGQPKDVILCSKVGYLHHFINYYALGNKPDENSAHLRTH